MHRAKAKLHKRESCFYHLKCGIQVATLYTIYKETPTEVCLFHDPSQNPHPSTASTHSKSVLTASLFLSVLVVPCYALLLWVLQSSHGSQVRKQQCQCLSFTLVTCQHTHLHNRQTVFSLSVSTKQIKTRFQLCHLTARPILS